MTRSFYLSLFYFLSIFLLPKNSFAVTEQRNSTQIGIHKKVKAKKQKRFAKIKEKIKKLKEKKAWVLIGLAILSAFVFSLMTVIFAPGTFAIGGLLFQLGISLFGILLYFTTRNRWGKHPKIWLIIPIIINLGLAALLGLILIAIGDD